MNHLVALMPFKQFEETFAALMKVIEHTDMEITIAGNVKKEELANYPFIRNVIYIPHPEHYKDEDGPFFKALDACYAERPFSAIINFFEEYVELAARITRRFGLNGNSEETAFLTRNKYAMRGALAGRGLHVPAFKKVSSYDEFLSAVREIGFPCVVKPLDGMASEGVLKLEGERDFRALYEAMMEDNKRIAKTCFSELLVEEYISGPEISWEAVVSAGRLHIMGITEKMTEEEPFFNEIMHIHPAQLPEEIEKEIHEAGVKAVEALKIQYGGVHMEARITPRGVYIMEVASRLGGDAIPTLVNLSKGYDPYGYVFKSGLNEDLVLKQTRNKVAGIRFIQADREGVLKEALFDEEGLRKIPGIITKRVFGRKDEYIARPPKGRTNRLAYITIAGRSYQEVREHLLAAEKCLKYVIE